MNKPIQIFANKYVSIDWLLPIKGDKLGHVEKPTYFFDESLLSYDLIWCAGGTPNSLFEIKTIDLIESIKPKIVKLI